MSMAQFANENQNFPKHFNISRAIAVECLDYLQNQLLDLKLENRDWVPLAISLAYPLKENGHGGIDSYKEKKEGIEREFLSRDFAGEKNRDIVTISAMQEEKLAFILEIAISELGPLKFVQNPKEAIDMLERWCEVGLILLKEIWQIPDYNNTQGFAEALSLIAKGDTTSLFMKLAMDRNGGTP